MAETDIQGLVEGLAAELNAAIVLEDIDFRLLAHTEHGDVIDEVRRRSIMGRAATPEVRTWFEQWGIRDMTDSVRTPADTTVGALARWCISVRFRGMHFGYIWVLDSGNLTKDELGPGMQAAEQIGALLYRRRLSAQADSDLLRLLLIPNSENEQIAMEARASGVHTHTGPIAVVVAGATDGDPRGPTALSDLALASQRAAEQASYGAVLSGVISELGVLLAPLRMHDDLAPARRLAEQLFRFATHLDPESQLVAAIGSATDFEGASRSYAEARRALRIVRAIPDLGPIVAWDELGIFRTLAFLPSDEVERGVLDPRVRVLLADNELVSTAEMFLDCAGNVKNTAARLFLHRATLYQRLDRIAERYELDLRRNGEHRLLTHLGLKLARVYRR